MWTLCDYLKSFHGIYILKYLPWFRECLCEIVTIDLSFASASRYLSMTLPLSPSHRPIRHTCMSFTCNQQQYIGRRSMQPLPGWCLCRGWLSSVFFPSCSPRNQTASVSGSHPSLSTDPQKSDLAPVPDHGYLLKAFLVSSFNKGFWGIWVSVPTTLIKPVHTYDTLAKIMANLKYGHNWNQTLNIFLTHGRFIYFFLLFFWMWTWSQAASHVAGKLPCAAFTKDKSLHVGGSRGLAPRKTHTHKKTHTKKCYTTSHFQKTNKIEKKTWIECRQQMCADDKSGYFEVLDF